MEKNWDGIQVFLTYKLIFLTNYAILLIFTSYTLEHSNLLFVYKILLEYSNPHSLTTLYICFWATMLDLSS